MLYAQPGGTFEVTAGNAPAGLVGTIGVRLIANVDGSTALARTTAGITEPLANSGVYVVKLTAPLTAGSYTILWDIGGSIEPSKVTADELVVQAATTIGEGGGSGTAVSALIAEVLGDASFDATNAQALRWLNRRHEVLCARGKLIRKKVSVGPTVKEQQSYAIPSEVLEIREVLVGSSLTSVGVPYGAGRETDLAEGALGYIWLGGLYLGAGGGIYTRDESGAGADLLALFPTPTEAGLSITLRAVCRAAPLAEGAAVATPPEYDDALVAGAVATGYGRLEGRYDLAAAEEAKFAQACVELEEMAQRRYRGSGPVRVRVRGYNA